MEGLRSIGISGNAAEKGLYYTGNESADQAAEWVFNHMDDPTLDSPLDEVIVSSSHVTSCKMIFVVNSSLGMSCGKTAAQVAHAAVDLYRNAATKPFDHPHHQFIVSWQTTGETKIVLKGQSVGELEALVEKAEQLRLITSTIRDAGKTEIPSGTLTVVAIAGKTSEVDTVTGHLNLL
ncbi:probable peptidyl-tRNA hydrolase 2 [Oscarella lobularis]|uniref:probable peptidyl-tRNA hydrolase 2 n=1 Tax=Oscarella lobularis TaxID=121494 RepID=UPI0033141CE9